MKGLLRVALSVLLVVAFAGPGLAKDTLEDVKKKGVLVAGVKPSSPPFSYVDRSGEIVGYDVDVVKAIATKLGVELRLVLVTPESRIPELLEGNIDIIASTMTNNPDRAKFIDFCHTAFTTGQKFLTKAGTVKELKDLEGKKIATAKGSISELNLKEALPGTRVVPYDDYPQAVTALLKGDIDAVSTDEAILLDLLAGLPRGAYEIPEISITHDQYGLGVRKGDRNILEYVHNTMIEMERSGEGKRIHDKWFSVGKAGKNSAYGVIIRATGAENRFLVIAFNGAFKTDARLSVFDPTGNLVGKGVVKSVFGDEIYVDVDDAKNVGGGFIVGMNANGDEVKPVIEKYRDILTSIRQEGKKEAESRLGEIKKDAEEDRKKRDVHREQVHMKQLEYERDRYFRSYGSGYWRSR